MIIIILLTINFVLLIIGFLMIIQDLFASLAGKNEDREGKLPRKSTRGYGFVMLAFFMVILVSIGNIANA